MVSKEHWPLDTKRQLNWSLLIMHLLEEAERLGVTPAFVLIRETKTGKARPGHHGFHPSPRLVRKIKRAEDRIARKGKCRTAGMSLLIVDGETLGLIMVTCLWPGRLQRLQRIADYRPAGYEAWFQTEPTP